MISSFSLQGTISLGQFWSGVLLANVVVFLTYLVFLLFIVFIAPNEVFALAAYFCFALLIFVFCVLARKRLTDAGLSPWLCLLLVVPLVSLLVLLFVGYKPTAAQRPDATTSN